MKRIFSVHKLMAIVLLGFCFLNLQACHTLKFEIASEQNQTVVQDTNWFFLFGWFPTKEIDVSQKCPYGASAIREQTTFVDGLISMVTLDMVFPRSVWYYCLPPGTSSKITAEVMMKEGGK
jgi:hypothetical protein